MFLFENLKFITMKKKVNVFKGLTGMKCVNCGSEYNDTDKYNLLCPKCYAEGIKQILNEEENRATARSSE